MGQVMDRIDDNLERWILEQPVFFVGTAPRGDEGHVNVSPKGGIGALVILDANRIAYLDIAGSGAETIAHLRENGRIVVMFCAFEGRPRIVRLHGTGRVHQVADPSFAGLFERFTATDIPTEGVRSIIEIDVTRVADSCGYSVPLMSFTGWRPHRDLWIDKKLTQFGPDGIKSYMLDKNLTSLDGLPAVDPDGLT